MCSMIPLNPQEPTSISLYKTKYSDAFSRGDSYSARVWKGQLFAAETILRLLNQEIHQLNIACRSYHLVHPMDTYMRSLCLNRIYLIQCRVIGLQERLIDPRYPPITPKTREQIKTTIQYIAFLNMRIYPPPKKREEIEQRTLDIICRSKISCVSIKFTDLENGKMEKTYSLIPAFEKEDINSILLTAQKIVAKSLENVPNHAVQWIDPTRSECITGIFIMYRYEAAIALSMKFLSDRKLRFSQLFLELIDNPRVLQLHEFNPRLLPIIERMFLQSTNFWFPIELDAQPA